MSEIKRKSYQQDIYWGRPVPGFGDPRARLMIVGLAPSAHGANRTGRIFTGDRSGDWLYRALHKAGFANQPHSIHIKDGLTLNDTYITCVVKCAPPENKPSFLEESRCHSFLKQEMDWIEPRIWIAFGQIALNALWPLLPHRASRRPSLKHGAEIPLEGNRWLLLSYHPSQQNTFTGKLTEPMFDSIFLRTKELLAT